MAYLNVHLSPVQLICLLAQCTYRILTHSFSLSADCQTRVEYDMIGSIGLYKLQFCSPLSTHLMISFVGLATSSLPHLMVKTKLSSDKETSCQVHLINSYARIRASVCSPVMLSNMAKDFPGYRAPDCFGVSNKESQ